MPWTRFQRAGPEGSWDPWEPRALEGPPPAAERPRTAHSPVLKMLWAFTLPSFAAWMRWRAPTASSFGTDIPSTNSRSSVWTEGRRRSCHYCAAAALWGSRAYHCACRQRAPTWEDSVFFSHLQSFLSAVKVYIHCPRGLCHPLAAWLYITRNFPTWKSLDSGHSLLPSPPGSSLLTWRTHIKESLRCFFPKLSDSAAFISFISFLIHPGCTGALFASARLCQEVTGPKEQTQTRV